MGSVAQAAAHGITRAASFWRCRVEARSRYALRPVAMRASEQAASQRSGMPRWRYW